MTLMIELMKNMVTIYSFMLFLGVFAIVIILELKYIRKRSRGRIALPIILILIAVVSYGIFPAKHMTENATILSISVLNDTTKIGVLHTLVDRDRALIATGQYITENEENRQFVNININKGTVNLDKPFDAEAEFIGKALNNYDINIGDEEKESLIYEELVSLKEERNQLRNVNHKYYLFGLLIFCLPVLSCFVLLFYDKINRRRKNMMKKMKLMDLN
ncbi:hypothetical protein M2140_001477 [Clostridiales Family XIII bacterium PM5-7]